MNQNMQGYNSIPNNEMPMNNQNTQGYNSIPNNEMLMNNQNMQGYNSIPNNEMPMNNQNMQGYNSIPNNEMPMNNQNMQGNFNYQMQYQYNNGINNNSNAKNKKLKWWIPVLLFIVAVLSQIIKSVISMISGTSGATGGSQILQMLQSILSIIYLLSTFLIIPSIVYVIITYNKKTSEDKKEVNNMIASANSLDEKLLIAYIGENYNNINSNKFSIPAFFFNWIYMLYRKIYIPAIIGMIIVALLDFLPSTLYTLIIIAVIIILGSNFNKWYITYAKKQIEKISSENYNISQNELIDIVKEKGGTNIWLAILIYIGLSIIVQII